MSHPTWANDVGPTVIIAALSAENHPAFVAIHPKKIKARTRRIGNNAANIVLPSIDAMVEVANTNGWRSLQEYEQKRTPESEHLCKLLQPRPVKLNVARVGLIDAVLNGQWKRLVTSLRRPGVEGNPRAVSELPRR